MNPPPPSPAPRIDPAPERVPWIDAAQFRALARLYYRLATRGSMMPALGRRSKGFHFFGGLAFFALIGSSFGVIAFMPHIDVFTFALYAHMMTFLLVGITAITESSLILFNPIEEEVLGHRPIAPRTLVAAKMTNMVGTTLLLAVALNLVPTFSTLHIAEARGWVPLVHLLVLVWEVVFCVAGVVFFYGIVARLVGRERFQTLVTWSQIAMTVLVMAGAQIMPRVMGGVQAKGLDHLAAYLAPLPPAWFAALEAVLATGKPHGWLAGLALLGLLAAPFLAWGAVVRLAAMQQRVSASVTEKDSTAPARAARAARAPKPLGAFLRWWLRDPVERASFRLAAAYMRRDRQIMQALYPNLAFLIIYPFLMAFTGRERNSLMFLAFGLGILASMINTALMILAHSEHCAAGELFAFAPLSRPVALFHGARKAILYYLVLPGAILLMLIFFFLSRDPLRELLIALPMLFLIPTVSLFLALDEVWLPLSQPPIQGRQQARSVMILLTLLVTMLVGGGSYLLSRIGMLWTIYAIGIPVLLIVHWGMTRHIARPRLIRISEGRKDD